MGSRQDRKTERRGWFDRLHLSWPMLLLVGWLLYELTTQPMLGAVAVCLKYGWEDFRAAIWLRRADPWRLRGRACFWLYLAWGLAKIAGVAGLMSLAFAIASPKGAAAQGPRREAIMIMIGWTGLTTLAGLVCSMLTFGYAVVLARWGGYQLWLSRDVHRARRRNDWPPYDPDNIQSNRLEVMLVGALFVFFISSFLLVLLTTIMFAPFDGLLMFVFLMLLMFGIPVLLLHCRDRIGRWLIASHPSECWDREAVTSSDAESMAEMLDHPLK